MSANVKRIGASGINTKTVKDRTKRKKLKREARSKRPAKPKRTDPRGSHKPKIRKKGPGAPATRT